MADNIRHRGMDPYPRGDLLQVQRPPRPVVDSDDDQPPPAQKRHVESGAELSLPPRPDTAPPLPPSDEKPAVVAITPSASSTKSGPSTLDDLMASHQSTESHEAAMREPASSRHSATRRPESAPAPAPLQIEPQKNFLDNEDDRALWRSLGIDSETPEQPAKNKPPAKSVKEGARRRRR